jgi:hypothetical protein
MGWFVVVDIVLYDNDDIVLHESDVVHDGQTVITTLGIEIETR